MCYMFNHSVLQILQLVEVQTDSQGQAYVCLARRCDMCLTGHQKQSHYSEHLPDMNNDSIRILQMTGGSSGAVCRTIPHNVGGDRPHIYYLLG